MRSKKTKNLALFAFFLAVELILLFTPLGFLRIGPLSATLMHIPVIIAAITMGWKYGCALGLVFDYVVSGALLLHRDQHHFVSLRLLR